MHDRLPALVGAEADEIADRLGDLPLALAQAAGLMVEQGMTAPDYLDALAAHSAAIADEGQVATYPTTLAAAVRLSTTRLAAADPLAVHLLQVCAMLAAEPIPGPILSHVDASPAGSRHGLRRIARYGLARVGAGEVQMHRLIQAIIADQLTPTERAWARTAAEQALVAADPGVNPPGAWRTPLCGFGPSGLCHKSLVLDG
jgi:hypothetical protein